MEQAKKVMEMAGYWAGHAVQGVATGEMLIPIVGYLGTDQQTSMERLLMDSSVEAMQQGDARITNLAADKLGAVFIRDGLVTLPTGKTDCLIVDIRFASDKQRHFQWLLPYRNAGHEAGFAVHKPKASAGAGFSNDELQELAAAFFDGLENNEEALEVWNSNFVDQAGESSGFHGQENTNFTAEEFQALRRAPFMVFLLVAAADGKLDNKEAQAFVKQLGDSAKEGGELYSRIITNVITDVPQLLTELLTTPFNHAQELLRIRLIVETKVSAEEAQAFKQALLGLGKTVASASGGFLGFGSKISKEEKATLERIAAGLGLTYS